MEAISEKKVSTHYLQQGMYVSSLDRPWLDTPFLIQGFLINSDDEIAQLKKYCEHVFIDPSKGLGAAQYVHEHGLLKTNDILEQCVVNQTRIVEYVDSRSTAQEIPVAKMTVEDASMRVVEMMESVKAGKSIDVNQVKGVVEPIMESIIRNPDALMWLTQIRDKDSYTYSHSVNSSAVAIAFGRHMGLPKKDLNILAMGLLLMDIGKMKIPVDILNKSEPLTEEEFKLVRSHVGHSVNILEKSEGIDTDIINIALTHHERFDGSGYPSGLFGTQTPVYGRIAAIIDCYGAMTSRRPYGTPVSPYAALQEIYNWRNKYFQEELVEQFLQCLGVFPTGSMVEMHTGEVGIVMAQNKTRRMNPKVMLLLDADKNAYVEYRVVDLAKQSSEHDQDPLTILRGLDPGAYGIDPGEFYL